MAFELADQRLAVDRKHLAGAAEHGLYDTLKGSKQHVEDVNVFICSFSENGDSLAQWRAYCGESGYALGFASDNLRQLALAQRFIFSPCIYRPEEHDEMVNDLIRSLLEVFRAGLGASKPSRVEEWTEKVHDAYLGAMTLYGPLMKLCNS